MSRPVYSKCNLNPSSVRYTTYGHYRPKLWQKKKNKKGRAWHCWQCSACRRKFSDVIRYVVLCVIQNKQGYFLCISIQQLTCPPPMICYIPLWNGKAFHPPKPYPNKRCIFQRSINTRFQNPTLSDTSNTLTLHNF